MSHVVIETNFILLIIFVMIAIFWFVSMSEIKMGSHKNAFAVGVLSVICACASRIFCIYVDHHHENMSTNTVAMAHVLYLSSLMVAYASYGYFTLCIINYHVRLKKAALYSFFTPVFITILLLILSRYTGFIFKVDPVEGYLHGPFHFIVYLIPIFYFTPGVLTLIKKRKYLPFDLLKCTVFTLIFFIIGITIFLLTGSKFMLFGIITFIMLLQLFTVLLYDRYWDEVSKTMNMDAFDFFIKRYLEKNKNLNVFMLKIVGFGYFKESKDEEIVNSMISTFAEELLGLSKVSTVYYLLNGIFAVAFDEDDHVDIDEFTQKLIKSCNQPQSALIERLSPDVDISLIRIPKDVNDIRMIYSYINEKKSVIETRDEKVRLLEKEKLHMEDAYRVDNILKSVRQVIQNRQFQIYYQPIYDVKEKKFRTAEALIRLKDPVMGFIPPNEFIPLTEKNGLIMDIGFQVFEQVCSFMDTQAFKACGLDFIEVNVSLSQFLDESLPNRLLTMMDKYHIPYSRINLEITETETPFEENIMRAQLKKMSELGFQFSLDDYGTGYSNIEAVTEYPLQIIKLDKSLIWSAFQKKKAMLTLESLVHLFHRLGFRIVAEGVETEEMFRELENLEVDFIQGYYFSRPLPETEFISFLQNVQLK